VNHQSCLPVVFKAVAAAVVVELAVSSSALAGPLVFSSQLFRKRYCDRVGDRHVESYDGI
jgi:hypothetical protein